MNVSNFKYCIFSSNNLFVETASQLWSVKTKAPICNHQVEEIAAKTRKYVFVHNGLPSIVPLDPAERKGSLHCHSMVYPIVHYFGTLKDARAFAKVFQSEPWTVKHSEVTYSYSRVVTRRTKPAPPVKIHFVEVFQPSSCAECISASTSTPIAVDDFALSERKNAAILPPNFFTQYEVESVKHFELESYTTFFEAHQRVFKLLGNCIALHNRFEDPTVSLKLERQYKINHGLENIFGNDRNRQLNSKMKGFAENNSTSQVMVTETSLHLSLRFDTASS